MMMLLAQQGTLLLADGMLVAHIHLYDDASYPAENFTTYRWGVGSLDIIKQNPTVTGNPQHFNGAWSENQALLVMLSELAVVSKHKSGCRELIRFFLGVVWSGKVEEYGPHRELQQAINHKKSQIIANTRGVTRAGLKLLKRHLKFG